jgi:hypothetical protein
MKTRAVLWLVGLALGTLAGATFATTIRVPSEYPTIQAGIDAASACH